MYGVPSFHPAFAFPPTYTEVADEVSSKVDAFSHPHHHRPVHCVSREWVFFAPEVPPRLRSCPQLQFALDTNASVGAVSNQRGWDFIWPTVRVGLFSRQTISSWVVGGRKGRTQDLKLWRAWQLGRSPRSCRLSGCGLWELSTLGMTYLMASSLLHPGRSWHSLMLVSELKNNNKPTRNHLLFAMPIFWITALNVIYFTPKKNPGSLHLRPATRVGNHWAFSHIHIPIGHLPPGVVILFCWWHSEQRLKKVQQKNLWILP